MMNQEQHQQHHTGSIIPVKINEETQQQVVSTRLLHEKLGINKDFTDWFKYQASRLALLEGRDFSTIKGNRAGDSIGRPKTDYLVPLYVAKNICMISGGEKAQQIRDYFITVEMAWNSPEKIIERALKFSQMRIAQLESQAAQDRPKVMFAEAVSASPSSILIGALAKLICQNGYQIGQNRLFEWLRENSYLMKRGEDRNMPVQRYVETGLFEIKESVNQDADGVPHINRTTKVTGKGQQYFINLFCGSQKRLERGVAA